MSNKFENTTGAADVSPFKIRFADAPWFLKAKSETALILGSGGIGSNLIFLLHSVGVNMHIYDDDIIASENIGQQNFKVSQIGLPKVTGIRNTCYEYLGEESIIEAYHKRYTEDDYSHHIIFAAFDNMASRKLAYDKWVELLESSSEEDKVNFIFIDGRLLAEAYQIYTVTSENYKKYAETLFEDSEVEGEPCTMKATRFASWGITSDMTALFLNWCTNLAYDEDIREVPFKIEKSYASFYYKAD